MPMLKCPKCGYAKFMATPEEQEQLSSDYAKSNYRWSKQDHNLLARLCDEGQPLMQISEQLDRSPASIVKKIERLGLYYLPKRPEPKDERSDAEKYPGSAAG